MRSICSVIVFVHDDALTVYYYFEEFVILWACNGVFWVLVLGLLGLICYAPVLGLVLFWDSLFRRLVLGVSWMGAVSCFLF